MCPNPAPWAALSFTLVEQRAREILQAGPQAHLRALRMPVPLARHGGQPLPRPAGDGSGHLVPQVVTQPAGA